MLHQRGCNPTETEKRLVSGIDEQLQMPRQITDVIGRRFLTNAADTLDQDGLDRDASLANAGGVT